MVFSLADGLRAAAGDPAVINPLTENLILDRALVKEIAEMYRSSSKNALTRLQLSCMITQVVEMEKIVEQGLLYDFYGELLTEHQRRIYEDMVFNDLSPSEIAKEQGISRSKRP